MERFRDNFLSKKNTGMERFRDCGMEWFHSIPLHSQTEHTPNEPHNLYILVSSSWFPLGKIYATKFPLLSVCSDKNVK